MSQLSAPLPYISACQRNIIRSDAFSSRVRCPARSRRLSGDLLLSSTQERTFVHTSPYHPITSRLRLNRKRVASWFARSPPNVIEERGMTHESDAQQPWSFTHCTMASAACPGTICEVSRMMSGELAGRSHSELRSPPGRQASSDPTMLRNYFPIPSVSFTPACAFERSRLTCSYPRPACPPTRAPAWGAAMCSRLTCSYPRPACPPTRSPAWSAAMCWCVTCSYPRPAWPPIRSPDWLASMTSTAETA